MKLRVAIPLLAICLASPAMSSGEQAKKGRGYSPRGESGGGQTATRSGGDSNRGSDTSRGGGDRTATSSSRPAERRADSRPTERRAENPPEERRAVSRPEERRAEGGTNERDHGRQRYAVPRDNPSYTSTTNYYGRNNNRSFSGSRDWPRFNINIGSSHRGHYAPVHYDYWARRYYRWSPIGYAPWSLIYGSIGFSNYGYYGGVGPNPFYYGYNGQTWGYGPGSYGYSPVPFPIDGVGSIRLRVRPRDAQVFIDGYYAGVVDDFDGTFQSMRVVAGGHKIEIRMPGFEDLELDVHVQPGRTITLREDLRIRP
jgi:hypothetical protein